MKKKLQSARAEAGSISDTKSNTMRLSDVIEMRGVEMLIGDGEYSVCVVVDADDGAMRVV